MSKAPAVRKAVAALKTGRPVRVGALTVLSVETATSEMLELLDPSASGRLLISGHRAAALSLGNLREAAEPERPVLIERFPWLTADAAQALADPAQDLARAPLGPLQPMVLEAEADAQAALALARRSGLLPALWLIDGIEGQVSVEARDIGGAAANVALLARARLPLDGMPDTQIAAFRAADDGQEHVALVVGAFGGEPPLVRLHSECLTGDVFGSLKCDCGPQLTEALRLIGAEGGGVLLYLRQEGRGIGLANKLRAYALQDRGLDTVDANTRLGFADDERDYAHAAGILRALGIDRVRLLTNNPSKAEGLAAAGISMVERVPHSMPANPHNADYLETKRRKSGHLG